MKLFRCNADITLYCWAKDKKEAERITFDSFKDEEATIFAIEVTKKEQIEPEWRNGLPYSEDGEEEKSCLELFEASKV